MRILTFALAVVVLAGCHASDNVGLTGRPLSNRDADRQYKARLLVLEDGQTTRDDILSIMGDPDRDADQVIMYYWTVRDREWEGIVRSFVLAEFDRKGTLIRHHQYDQPAPEFGGPKLPDEAWNEFTGQVAR